MVSNISCLHSLYIVNSPYVNPLSRSSSEVPGRTQLFRSPKGCDTSEISANQLCECPCLCRHTQKIKYYTHILEQEGEVEGSIFLLLSVSGVWLSVTPWTVAHQTSLTFTVSQSLLKFRSTESMMPSNPLTLCHSLFLPSILPSIRVFSNELALCIRWPKYWSFSFSISPSSEYSALITFRIDWFELLGSVKCLHLTNCFLSLDETCKALFTTITNPCNYKNCIFKRRKLNVMHSTILSKCLVPCLACSRT